MGNFCINLPPYEAVARISFLAAAVFVLVNSIGNFRQLESYFFIKIGFVTFYSQLLDIFLLIGWQDLTAKSPGQSHLNFVDTGQFCLLRCLRIREQPST
jgi:hypothetical protein